VAIDCPRRRTIHHAVPRPSTPSLPQYITRPPDDKLFAATLNFVLSLENEALSVGPPVLSIDACLELTPKAQGGLCHFV